VPGSVIASCNWTGTRGPTGLFEPGTGTEAAQGPATRFNKPLNVKVGDVFYLAIDNFSVNALGFNIDFNGLDFGGPDDSTAVVNPPPTNSLVMNVVRNICPDKRIRVQFSSRVPCDSVTPSKLFISGPNPPYTITSVVAANSCNGFAGTDTSFYVSFQPDSLYDSLTITTEGQIRDMCGNQVQSTSVPFRLRNCTVGVLPFLKAGGSFQIQPNPGMGLFHLISKDGLKPTEIRVIDSQGKLLSTKTSEEKDLIDLRKFPSGLYTVQILSPSGIEFLRVMKE
jgi:hypothetical protein